MIILTLLTAWFEQIATFTGVLVVIGFFAQIIILPLKTVWKSLPFKIIK